MSSVLVFPHTRLRRAMIGGMLPWLHPLVIMSPASLSEKPVGRKLLETGLFELLTPLDRPTHPSTEEVLKTLRQWEEWVAVQRGAGRLESLKAGVNPPTPVVENLRTVMADIKDPERKPPLSGAAQPPPPKDPEVLVHLAHIWENQAAEMEELAALVDKKSTSLGDILADDDSVSEELKSFNDLPLSPPDQEQNDERLLSQRLEAWSSLLIGVDKDQLFLATANLPAARLLLERANQAFYDRENNQRSAAGATSLVDLFKPESRVENPALSVEAFRISLPEVLAPDMESLVRICLDMKADSVFSELAAEFEALLRYLGENPWSEELGENAKQKAKGLGNEMIKAMKQSGIALGPGQVNLSSLVFPGLDRAQLFELLRGRSVPFSERHLQKGSSVVIIAWPMAL
jgi:predicted transcriptional regulator